MAILIGDDGSLISSTKGNTVTFEYVIYSQGFAEEVCLLIKRIIERYTGLRLSITRATKEFGIRLTITEISQVKLVSHKISPYLALIKNDIFQKNMTLASTYIIYLKSTRNSLPLQNPKITGQIRKLALLKRV